MNYKESLGSKLFDILNYLFLCFFALSILYPFLYMFSISISEPVSVGLNKVKLFPIGFQLKAYITVFCDQQIMRSYYNSVLYTLSGTITVLILNSLAAYSLSRKRFKANNFFVIVFTIPMFFGGGMIPAYLNIRNLHLLDTMWAIILPGAIGMWFIILFRTNFKQLPESLFEAAYIDGANDWYIYFRIVLPLSKPILATIAVFASVGIWNNYFGPLLYLSSPEKAPLTIILKRLLVTKEHFASAEQAAQAAIVENPEETGIAYQGTLVSLRMATIFATLGPIILVYPFAQKYFVKGVMIGSIKG